jgi:hypothetical protein
VGPCAILLLISKLSRYPPSACTPPPLTFKPWSSFLHEFLRPDFSSRVYAKSVMAQVCGCMPGSTVVCVGGREGGGAIFTPVGCYRANLPLPLPPQDTSLVGLDESAAEHALHTIALRIRWLDGGIRDLVREAGSLGASG